ncbi:helix-turn-helix domain-containing protein [Thermodesulfovibrio yellowstonii]|uniref:Transcriptional regulator n=1 Tax=Thermodesulfovibrio yellowstonii TaxID=28262 RepID=A0A9W6GF87_9BACT|nr:helix-turn-helix transcriptional regulator [Thermodesulfovibrio islandicus]GLI52776.1 transcriptional regulator [Thermodesulfovibrio islandicus]
MKKLRDILKEQFKDEKFKEDFYRGLEKTRIATEIAYYREKRGLTQAQLAKKLGTSQSTIARLEDPFYDNYSLNTLRKIAKVLDLELIVSLREKDERAQEEFTPIADSNTQQKTNRKSNKKRGSKPLISIH